MIETLDNSIQLILTGLCSMIAFVRAVQVQRREWLLLGLFFVTFFLGDLYWTLYYIFYSRTLVYSFIPNLSWYTSYLFLAILLLLVKDKKEEDKAPIMLYLIPAFTIAMCAYYMTFGDYVSNLAVAVLMTVIMWNAAKGLIRVRKQEEGAEKLGLYMMSFLFCIVEYAMWTSSCIWEGNTILYPYYWFDFLLSICFILFIPAVRKMVDE